MLRYLLILTAAAAVLSAPNAAIARSSAPLSIFVLAGQSNMAGYGEPVPSTQETSPRVWDLTHGIKRARDPLGDAPGVGPGLSFGLELAHRGMRIGLVNCAVGSSFMRDWLPDGQWFIDCMALAHQAERYGKVRGIIFMQGESDQSSQDLALLWGSRFATFTAAARAELSQPRLPIVFGRVLDFSGCGECGLPFGAQVRAQQTAVKLPRVAMVTADDLPHNGEHFTPAGYRVLGHRFALSWLRLTRGS